MNETYAVAIMRAGIADLPELARAQTSEAAAALVRALLDCRDPYIVSVTVRIERVSVSDSPK